MKIEQWVSAALVSLGLVGGFAGTAPAQAPAADKGVQAVAGEPARVPPSPRVLDALAGRWKLEATQFVRGKPPVRTAGTSENTWILGGRFLQCAASVGEGEGRFESLTTFGYDRRSSEYFAVAVTTSDLPYVSLHGPYYDASRSFVLRGDDTSSVGVRFRRRYVIRLEGKDRYVIETFVEYPGTAPALSVEVVYTRQ